MSRRTRLALLTGAALVLLVTGSVLARPVAPAPPDNPGLASTHQPEPQDGGEPEAPPSAEDVAHAVDRLAARGITTDTGTLSALADQYGLGGAVRLTAWASLGHDIAELQAMRDEGMGWGRIAREIGERPGIGWVMGRGGGAGGLGLGLEHAPGQQRDDAP